MQPQVAPVMEVFTQSISAGAVVVVDVVVEVEVCRHISIRLDIGSCSRIMAYCGARS